jgi:hypothetical protein
MKKKGKKKKPLIGHVFDFDNNCHFQFFLIEIQNQITANFHEETSKELWIYKKRLFDLIFLRTKIMKLKINLENGWGLGAITN